MRLKVCRLRITDGIVWLITTEDPFIFIKHLEHMFSCTIFINTVVISYMAPWISMFGTLLHIWHCIYHLLYSKYYKNTYCRRTKRPCLSGKSYACIQWFSHFVHVCLFCFQYWPLFCIHYNVFRGLCDVCIWWNRNDNCARKSQATFFPVDETFQYRIFQHQSIGRNHNLWWILPIVLFARIGFCNTSADTNIGIRNDVDSQKCDK